MEYAQTMKQSTRTICVHIASVAMLLASFKLSVIHISSSIMEAPVAVDHIVSPIALVPIVCGVNHFARAVTLILEPFPFIR